MTFEDDLLALEQRVIEEAAGAFLAAVAVLKALLVAGGGGVEARLIRLAIPDFEAKILAGVTEAHGMAVERATGLVEAPGLKPAEIEARVEKLRVPARVVKPVQGLTVRAVEAKSAARTLLRAGAPVEEALAPVFNAATSVRSTIETQVNAAANAGSLQVGEEFGSPMVWEAERDACVHCLALAGKVVKEAGETFPLVSYDRVPKGYVAVSAPPRHPRCRCQLSVLVDQSYADALKREAQRSILRGFSLQSESNAVRVRAAKKLLEMDPVAPKSVKAYARKAVKDGKFPRTRAVPDGGPRLVDG